MPPSALTAPEPPIESFSDWTSAEASAFARSGDRALERIAGHPVDLDSARPGDGRGAKLRNGHDEVRLAGMPAHVEPALVVVRTDGKRVAVDLDPRLLEQLSEPLPATLGLEPVRTSTS